MELDIIEIRAFNYFEYNREVRQIGPEDLAMLPQLLPGLKPIEINHRRLSRLNFDSIANNLDRRFLQKFCAGFYFNFYSTRNDKLLLVLNDQFKLPHILHVHQLQNLYYDLTGDVLKLPAKKS